MQCYDVVQLLSNSNVVGVVFANWTRDLIINFTLVLWL